MGERRDTEEGSSQFVPTTSVHKSLTVSSLCSFLWLQ